MTPEQVRAYRRRHRIPSGDRYAARGLEMFIERSAIGATLDAECREIGYILQQVPEFTERCGYGWAAEPASYDVPSEAAFQRRVLLMLAKYWVEAPDRTGLPERLGGVVVGQEFITRYGLCSPRIRQVGPGDRLLTVPAGFVELALWLFVGLRCWVALETGSGRDHGDDGGWTMVTTPVAPRDPRPFDHVTAYELMARTLAEQGRDEALFGMNAALLIREQVPGLAGESGEIDTDKLPFFDQNATYMVAEFALAHELGHLLSGHALNGREPPSDPVHETEADHQACLLLAMSSAKRLFGWGNDIHGPWVQAAIGLALFDCLLTGRTALVNGLLRRAGPTERETALIATERLRAATARLEIKNLLVRIAREGQPEDARRVATLVDNNNSFLRDLRQSVALLSDNQVSQAIDIARRSVDLRE
jgi:hypothetical protein